jgi:outer membrane cobalamin receptor
MQGIGKRYNQILKGKTLETVSYSGFNDLYARIDYKFNGKGRIWIQGSNLLNQDYQTWYGYKAFGLTVVGGISLAIF